MQPARPARAKRLFIHPRQLLPEFPCVTANEEVAALIRNGRAVNLPELSQARQVKVFAGQRELIAIATRIAGTLFHPRIVLAAEPARLLAPRNSVIRARHASAAKQLCSRRTHRSESSRVSVWEMIPLPAWVDIALFAVIGEQHGFWTGFGSINSTRREVGIVEVVLPLAVAADLAASP